MPATGCGHEQRVGGRALIRACLEGPWGRQIAPRAPGRTRWLPGSSGRLGICRRRRSCWCPCRSRGRSNSPPSRRRSCRSGRRSRGSCSHAALGDIGWVMDDGGTIGCTSHPLELGGSELVPLALAAGSALPKLQEGRQSPWALSIIQGCKQELQTRISRSPCRSNAATNTNLVDDLPQPVVHLLRRGPLGGVDGQHGLEQGGQVGGPVEKYGRDLGHSVDIGRSRAMGATM